MTQTPPPATSLPHHKLFAYELCLSLVKLVAKTRVADAPLRAQARKSAASAALNCAEGAAYGAAIMHAPAQWIVVGSLVLLGVGVVAAVKATRQRDSAE